MRGGGEWCRSGWRGETSDDLPTARIGPAASLIPMCTFPLLLVGFAWSYQRGIFVHLPTVLYYTTIV